MSAARRLELPNIDFGYPIAFKSADNKSYIGWEAFAASPLAFELSDYPNSLNKFTTEVKECAAMGRAHAILGKVKLLAPKPPDRSPSHHLVSSSPSKFKESLQRWMTVSTRILQEHVPKPPENPKNVIVNEKTAKKLEALVTRKEELAERGTELRQQLATIQNELDKNSIRELIALKEYVEIGVHNPWFSPFSSPVEPECFISNLPSELHNVIFSLLPANDLLSCSLVSRQWHRLASTEPLWNALTVAFVNNDSRLHTAFKPILTISQRSSKKALKTKETEAGRLPVIVPTWKRYYLLRKFYSDRMASAKALSKDRKLDDTLSKQLAESLNEVWGAFLSGSNTQGLVRNLEHFFVFFKETQLENSGTSPFYELLSMNMVNCATFASWGTAYLREAEVKIDTQAWILYRLASAKFGFSLVSGNKRKHLAKNSSDTKTTKKPPFDPRFIPLAEEFFRHFADIKADTTGFGGFGAILLDKSKSEGFTLENLAVETPPLFQPPAKSTKDPVEASVPTVDSVDPNDILLHEAELFMNRQKIAYHLGGVKPDHIPVGDRRTVSSTRITPSPFYFDFSSLPSSAPEPQPEPLEAKSVDGSATSLSNSSAFKFELPTSSTPEKPTVSSTSLSSAPFFWPSITSSISELSSPLPASSTLASAAPPFGALTSSAPSSPFQFSFGDSLSEPSTPSTSSPFSSHTSSRSKKAKGKAASDPLGALEVNLSPDTSFETTSPQLDLESVSPSEAGTLRNFSFKDSFTFSNDTTYMNVFHNLVELDGEKDEARHMIGGYSGDARLDMLKDIAFKKAEQIIIRKTGVLAIDKSRKGKPQEVELFSMLFPVLNFYHSYLFALEVQLRILPRLREAHPDNAALAETHRGVIETLLLHCHNLLSILPSIVIDATPSLVAYSSRSVKSVESDSEFAPTELKLPLVVDFRIENTCLCCGVRYPEKIRTLIYLLQGSAYKEAGMERMASKDRKGRDHHFALAADAYNAVLSLEAIHHFASLKLAILYAIWEKESECEKALKRYVASDPRNPHFDSLEFSSYRHLPWFKALIRERNQKMGNHNAGDEDLQPHGAFAPQIATPEELAGRVFKRVAKKK